MADDPSNDRAARKRQLREKLSFWRWFWFRGLRSQANRWLPVHLVIGMGLAYLIPDRLSTIAGSALIPLASLLVGLTFAWSGNAVALLQSDELQKVGRSNNGEVFRKWVFDYQLAILAILVTTTLWSLVAAGIVNNTYVMGAPAAIRYIGRTCMFALSSLTVRECWSVASLIQRKILTIVIAKEPAQGTARPDNHAGEKPAELPAHLSTGPMEQSDEQEEPVQPGNAADGASRRS